VRFAESEGGAAEVLQASVDGLRGAVAGAGPVEVGEHVAGSLGQRAAQGDDLGEGLGEGPRDFVAESFAAAMPAPLARLDYPARDHRTAGFDALPGRLAGRARRAGRTWSGQRRRSFRRARRGLPDGRCENFHPRETSTSIPGPTRQPRTTP